MDEKTYMDSVLKMQRALYRVAWSVLRSDADTADAVQEAVMKGWQARKSLRSDGALKAWLMKILINECRNIQRKEGRRRQAERELSDETERLVINESAEAGVADAMAALPEKYRLIVTLHYIEGYCYSEIAKITGMSEGLVKSRLYQARRALGSILEE